MTVDAEVVAQAAGVATTADLGQLLRHLRRREARERGHSALTYRELAARTGWSVAAVGEYVAGTTLPPTDRFDVLVQLLGATPAELGPLADARDRVEERRRPVGVRADGPRQLPADVYGFTGRTGAMAELDRLLSAGRSGPAVVVLSLTGTAGVGKTALAVHWAHAVADRFPDGQLYVDLRGHSPGAPVPPEEALAGFLRALGLDGARIPDGLTERAAAYRSEVAGRRVLVVLDNARTAEQVRPLLPGSPTCVALVTSRDDLAGLVARDGARRVAVDVLPVVEAVRLLRTLVGSRIDAEPAAADDLARACALLPLALRIVASRAAGRPDLPLSAVSGQLGEAFDGPDPATNLRAVFSWSYEALSSAAARLFRLLGLSPATDVTTRAAASLAGLSTLDIRPPLAELTRAHLFVEQAPGRFGTHDLLRAYAAELADADPEASPATARLLDHYLHSALDAARNLDAVRSSIAVAPPVAGVTPEDTVDHDGAARWFTAERRVLLAMVDLAAATGRPGHTWALAWTLTDFLDRRGHWHDLVHVQRLALEATRALGDRRAQARTHNGVAHAYTRLGRHDEAGAHYEQALALYRGLADRGGEARAHLNLGLLYGLREWHAQALHHVERAYELHRAEGNHAEEANALNAVGWAHAQLGNLTEALDHCERALRMVRHHGYELAEAATLDSLAYVRRQRGEYAEAAAHYRQAVRLLRAFGDRYHEADVLTSLGETCQAAGHPEEAAEEWRLALAIFVDLDVPDAARVRLLLDG